MKKVNVILELTLCLPVEMGALPYARLVRPSLGGHLQICSLVLKKEELKLEKVRKRVDMLIRGREMMSFP